MSTRQKLNLCTAALSLVLMSNSVVAHGNDRSCSFDMDYDFAINNSKISFSKETVSNIIIDQDNQLFFNGEQQSLTSDQQDLVDNYADGVRDLVPEVTAIALEGVNLGVKAATMALGTLLGESSPEYSRFLQLVDDLAQTITSKLDSDNFSTRDIEQTFDKDFENELEQVFEQAVADLTPIIMAQIINAAMSGDDSKVSELEQRAENLEHEIKQFIEPQAEALGARAEELCASVEILDEIEAKMVNSGLEMMDIIGKGDNYGKKFNRDRFKFNLSD